MKSFNQKLVAVIFVFLGIVLLLVNIGVISLEIKEYFVTYYPVLIVLVGLKFLVDTIFYQSRTLFVSLFLLAFGILLILDRLGYMTFEFLMFWKLWPLLIIYIGFKLFVRKRPVKVTFSKDMDFDFAFDSEAGTEEGEYGDSKSYGKGTKRVFTVGDLKMNKQNWSLEPLEVYNVVGDYYFDFSKAYIPDKETKIHLRGVVGDVKMLVPEDVPIRITSNVKLGQIRIFGGTSDGMGRKMSHESPNYAEATRKIEIVIELKIGDVRIDRV